MPLATVDANILIRFKTNDNPDMAEKAKQLFERVKRGEEHITTSEAVLSEVIFVLTSKKLYNLPRAEAQQYLIDFIKLKGNKMPNKRICLRALELYGTSHIDFTDTILVAYVEHGKADEVISFDERIGKISTVKRREP